MATLLGTALLSAQTANIVSRIGTDVVIGTLTTTASSVGRLLTYITDHPTLGTSEFKRELEDLDLQFFITVLDRLVKEQNTKDIQDSTKQALLGVNESLTKIQDELNSVKEAIEYHQTKYFASWRSFACPSLDSIKKHKKILETRYNLLTDLLQIYN